MKRLVIIILSIVPLLVAATNTLSLSTVSGHPDDVLTVTASLTNDDAVAAVQADIPLNAHMQYVASSAVLTPARSNGHTIVAAAVDDTLHVTVFSLTGATLTGNQGDLFSFQLRLGNEPATYPLSAALTLASAAGQALAASTSAGSITLLSPKIEVTTKTIDYGHIPIRASYTRTLSVRNTGNLPLHITDVLLSAPEFSVTNTQYTIPAGQTQNITVTFSPLLHGAISETVRLRSNAVNDADVYGANIATLIADPFSVNELRVQPASGISDDTVSVTLRMNNMETDLVGIQVSFKLPKQLEYIAGSAAPLARANGMTATSVLSGDTLTLMLYSLANTPVSDTDGDLMTFRLRLNGQSGSYTLKPLQTMLINAAGHNMVSAVYNANVTIQSPTISGNASISFPSLAVTRKDTLLYSVRNSGQAPLTIDGAAFLMEGFRLLTPMPVTIARNTGTTLEVEFTPSVEGNVSTTMQLYSNDPATRMKSVAITGSVYEPNGLSLSGEIQPDESYVVHIRMDNYTPIAGVQIDLQWLPGFMPEVLPTDRMNGFSSVCLPLDDTDTYQLVLYSLSGQLIPQGEGTICSLRFSGKPCAEYNDTYVQATHAVLSDASLLSRLTEDLPSLHVQEMRTLTVQTQHGTIQISPAQAQYLYGTQVTLTAVPDDGCRFIRWPDGETATSRSLTVTRDTVLTAMFLDANTFLITFLDEDGTLLQESTWSRNEIPACDEPTKDATDAYFYLFADWSPAVVPATADAVYTATYDSVASRYTITFESDEGDELCEDEWEYGTIPYCSEPTKEADEQYTYAFAGWSPEVEPVTGDATYTAVFVGTLRTYTVLFLDADGTVLQQSQVAYGDIPAYTGPTPTKAADAQYSYTFSGWNHEMDAIEGDMTFTAVYSTTLRTYLIVFLDEDGTVLCSDEWGYGLLPQCDIPVKADDEDYTYDFAGWTPAVETVSGEATYTATYTATPIPHEGLIPITNNQSPITNKVIKDGRLYILRGNRIYTATGVMVE